MKYLLKWLGIGSVIAGFCAIVVTLLIMVEYFVYFIFKFIWTFELYSYKQHQLVEENDKKWYHNGYTVHDKTPLDTWLRYYRTFYHLDISYLES